MKEQVILVDEHDIPVGECEKLKAHQNGGRLHRAISLFIFSSDGKMLLQKRATGKYHCGGLWTNTCCSHPRPKENTEEAAHRRLQEEMGFDCSLSEIYSFVYKIEFANGLTEHEYDHVFWGTWDGIPKINPEEADEWKWELPEIISEDMNKNPDAYTYWFRISFNDVVMRIHSRLRSGE